MKKKIPAFMLVCVIAFVWWLLGIGFYRVTIYNKSIDIKEGTVSRTIAIWHNADIIYRERYVSDLSLEKSGDSTMIAECDRLVKEQKSKP